jgi:hypothetical protein
MWERSFDARLHSWATLRSQIQTVSLDQALAGINQWWFRSPWTAYYLHWDDIEKWPDPWQLLEDNMFCSVARGLGILYTIVLIDRPDLQSAELLEVGGDNLVVIHGEKYILNWDRDQIVNINLTAKPGRRRISQQQLKKRIQ